MLIASIIAFFVAVLLLGIPSSRDFDQIGGHYLIWRSKWFLGSVVFHGLLAVAVLLLMQNMEITIKVGEADKGFEAYSWLYGLFAGLFYQGVLYSAIGLLSWNGVGIKESDTTIKSSMDFYSSFLGRRIQNDIDHICDAIIAQPKRRILEFENLKIEDILLAFLISGSSEDVGRMADQIREKKEGLAKNGFEEAISEEALKAPLLEDILKRFLIVKGKRQFTRAMAKVESTLIDMSKEKQSSPVEEPADEVN